MIDIEYLDTLPKRESISQSIVRRYGSLYETAKWEGYRHRVKHMYPWVIADDILHKYIGKSYDEAYSVFCKKLKEYGIKDPYDKHYFDEQIMGLGKWRTWRRNYNDEFMIDENKIIHYNEAYKSYRSFKTKRKFPFTVYVNKKPKEFETFVLKKEYKNRGWHYRIDSDKYWRLPIYIRDLYMSEFVENSKLITFESPKEKGFKRYMWEAIKSSRKAHRKYKKRQKEKEYSFLTQSEKARIEQRKIDLIKRDSHGFDEESFKGEHYHGQKRKKKN